MQEEQLAKCDHLIKILPKTSTIDEIKEGMD